MFSSTPVYLQLALHREELTRRLQADLDRAPFFVRGPAKEGAEKYAREVGASEVTMVSLFVCARVDLRGLCASCDFIRSTACTTSPSPSPLTITSTSAAAATVAGLRAGACEHHS